MRRTGRVCEACGAVIVPVAVEVDGVRVDPYYGTIERAGRAITTSRPMAALVARLLQAGKSGLTREQIGAILWDDADCIPLHPAQVIANRLQHLRPYLNRLNIDITNGTLGAMSSGTRLINVLPLPLPIETAGRPVVHKPEFTPTAHVP